MEREIKLPGGMYPMTPIIARRCKRVPSDQIPFQAIRFVCRGCREEVWLDWKSQLAVRDPLKAKYVTCEECFVRCTMEALKKKMAGMAPRDREEMYERIKKKLRGMLEDGGPSPTIGGLGPPVR